MRRLTIVTSLASAILLAVAMSAPAAQASALRVCPSTGPACPFKHLQDAINAASNGGSISIAPGTYDENLKVGPSTATRLTLLGEGGAGAVIVDGKKKDSVLVVSPGHTVTVVGLTLRNGTAKPTGVAQGNGGGIANLGGTVTVISSRIVDNTAAGQFPQGGFGGGVFSIDAGSINAGSGGGALSMTSTIVSGNKASNGGGVSTISFSAATHATLTNVTVEDNTATSGGAGGVQNCGTLTMTSSPIRNNTAAQGGGLTNCGNGGLSGTARLVSSPVSGNTATGNGPAGGGGLPPVPGHGGGISNGGRLVLISSPVTNNHAAAEGGGIFNSTNPDQGVGKLTRISSPVTGNTPDQCAGITC